jgi:hypothetical protein
MTDVNYPTDTDSEELEDEELMEDEDEETEDEDEDEETTDEDKEKRTRYSGPVLLDFEEAEDEIVDTTTLSLGRGRPAIDLSQYQQALSSNFGKNLGKGPKEKIAWKSKTNTPAVSTIKSRFNAAGAKMDPPIGINWLNDKVIQEPVEGSDDPNEQGVTLISFIATKRIVGRGRKPKPENGGPVVATDMATNAAAMSAQDERLGR